MFHLPRKGDPPGQLKQPIRICMSCKFVFWGAWRPCPKCGWPSYGAPFVFDGWIKSVFMWAYQTITKKEV